jgi:hypothetical protein
MRAKLSVRRILYPSVGKSSLQGLESNALQLK